MTEVKIIYLQLFLLILIVGCTLICQLGEIMSLGIPTQAEVVITCDGADEEAAIVAIEEGLRKEGVIA